MARQLAEASRAAREQGLAEGYAAGWATGRRAAAEAERREAAERAEREEATRRQLAARTQPLLAALAETARAFTEQVAPAWDEIGDVLLEGALRVAAAALGRELEAVDAVVLEAARTALRLLPTAEVVALHVNPVDVALVGEGENLPDGLRLVPDATVPAGTVVARSPLQSLPVDLRHALAGVEEVLRG
jgi:flagellar assembly protein FliH